MQGWLRGHTFAPPLSGALSILQSQVKKETDSAHHGRWVWNPGLDRRAPRFFFLSIAHGQQTARGVGLHEIIANLKIFPIVNPFLSYSSSISGSSLAGPIHDDCLFTTTRSGIPFSFSFQSFRRHFPVLQKPHHTLCSFLTLLYKKKKNLPPGGLKSLSIDQTPCQKTEQGRRTPVMLISTRLLSRYRRTKM